MGGPTSGGWTYKDVEKSFKGLEGLSSANPHMIDVVDFRDPGGNSARIQSLLHDVPAPPGSSGSLLCYGVQGYDGFFVLPAALSPQQQVGLARDCLERYTSPSNPSNLREKEAEGLEGGDEGDRSKGSGGEAQQHVLPKLAWVTLGYHFRWASRSYDPEYQSVFPPDLAALVQPWVKRVGQRIQPQAAIVNFYSPKRAMGGHRDEVELTWEHPVVSISLGLNAIFLLGGLGKSDPPLAMYLRSGDVVIMGGASRLRYHGVARVIQASDAGGTGCLCLPRSSQRERGCCCCCCCCDAGGEEEGERDASVRRYLRQHRININVRQVLPDGVDSFPPRPESPASGRSSAGVG